MNRRQFFGFFTKAVAVLTIAPSVLIQKSDARGSFVGNGATQNIELGFKPSIVVLRKHPWIPPKPMETTLHPAFYRIIERNGVLMRLGPGMDVPEGWAEKPDVLQPSGALKHQYMSLKRYHVEQFYGRV